MNINSIGDFFQYTYQSNLENKKKQQRYNTIISLILNLMFKSNQYNIMFC